MLSSTPVESCKRGRPVGFKLSALNRLDMEHRKMLDLWVRGVPLSDIARVLCRNVQTIHERLRPYRSLFPELETVNHSGERKMYVFNAVVFELLKSMTDTDGLKNVGLRDAAAALDMITRARVFDRRHGLG